MLYAQGKPFNNAEEHIYSELKSSDNWWNQVVHQLNFVTAVMILTASILTAAAWSYDGPCVRQFKPDTA
jgi:hypothetical protein